MALLLSTIFLPNLEWVSMLVSQQEVVRRDLRDWNVPRDLALDRTAWKSAIHLLES
jgi:hypothetical protein